jgi:hypothetical protein
MPDDPLRAAAAAGRLSTPTELEAEVRRMLADGRARKKVAQFHARWLQLDELDTLVRDPTAFPGYSDAIRGQLKLETETFVDHVFWDSTGRASELLEAPYTFLNAELASYYGAPPPAGAGLQRVLLDPSRRLGLLTHAGVLAAHTKSPRNARVHRGLFLRMGLMCHKLDPPPADVEALPDADRT